MIGSVVGNYKIISELGEGGVGTVYKGVDTMLDREVAIKVLRPELVSNNSVVERFRSEAVTLAKLNHPNIATLFSLFRQGNELFMILEFVEGETVEDILQRRGAISTEEALPFFCQALNGLNYAHKLKIVHRDIKPSNMILTSDNVLKILDFGIARLLGSSRMTKVGNIIGTLEYMSPEQIRGEETDARSDIYGLGIMLYEILTGRLPFESENEFALMKAHTEDMPALPRSLNADIPKEIEAAIIKAISKNPDERFQDADEFLQTMLDLGFSATNNPALGFESVYQSKISASRKKQIDKRFNSKDFPTDLEIEEETEKAAEQIQSEVEAANKKSTAANFTETAEVLPPSEDTAIPESAIEQTETNFTDSEAATETSEMPENSDSGISAANEAADDLSLAETQEVFSGEEQIEEGEVTEIKETRLGEPQNPQSGQMKLTRIGAAGDAEIKSTRYAESVPFSDSIGKDSEEKTYPAAIFENLNWMHYAGAGVVAFVFLSVVGIAAVSAIIGGGEEPLPAANTRTIEETENKPDETIPVKERTVSQPDLIPIENTDSGNSEETEPTPIEVAEEKPKDSGNGSEKKPVGGGKKPSGGGGKKPSGGGDKKPSGGGGKKPSGGGGSNGGSNIVEDMTKKPNPKPGTKPTPSLTDN